MESSTVSAPPGSRRSVFVSAASGRACRIFVACWALPGAAGCAFAFYWSAWPYTLPDEPPGPSWLSMVALVAALPALLWAVAPVPLLITGIVYLGRTGPAGWRWPAVWAGAVAAGAALEALVITGFAVPSVSPAYWGPAVVAWVFLAECAGFLVVGAAMTVVLMSPARSPACRIAGTAPA